MVNSKRWPEDRWITESFAEYMAMEYYDIRFQKPEKTLQQIREQWVDPLWMQTDTKTVTVTGAPVALRTGGRALTDGGQNVYTKGALVIRHLEYLFRVQKKGEGAFWELLTDFLKSNLYKPVTTEDFIAAAEKKIGGKLDWFWNQWVYGEGLPSVRWDHEVAPHPEGGWVLTVNVRQEGTDFTFPVPVRVDTGGEKPLETHLAIRGKEGGRLQVRLRDKPKRVTLNDEWRTPVEIRN
jgi:aminopeptidase N